MPAIPSNATALSLVQPASIDTRRAFERLSRTGAAWLGEEANSARPGTRRYLSDLSFPVRGRAPHVTFKKAAYVDLGEVRATNDGCVAEISWQSSSLAPLFPVFAGHLTIGPTALRLEGWYAPPGGGIGAVLDRAFLNIAARGTARWFLERAVGALTAPSMSGATGRSRPAAYGSSADESPADESRADSDPTLEAGSKALDDSAVEGQAVTSRAPGRGV
jgi:hypothetical protein